MPTTTRTVQTEHTLGGFLDWFVSPDAPGGAAISRTLDALRYFSPDPVNTVMSWVTGRPHISQSLFNVGMQELATIGSFLTGKPVSYPAIENAWETDPVYLRNDIALGRTPKYLAWVLANWDDIKSGRYTGSLNPEQEATVKAVEAIMQRGEDIPAFGIRFTKGATSPRQAQVYNEEKYRSYQAQATTMPENIRFANPAAEYARLNQRASLYDDAATRREASQITMALRDLAGHEALRRAEQDLNRDPTQVAELYWNGAYRFAADAWGLSDGQKEWLRQQLHKAAQEWAASGATVPFQDYLRQRALEHARVLTVAAQSAPPAQTAAVGRGVDGY